MFFSVDSIRPHCAQIKTFRLDDAYTRNHLKLVMDYIIRMYAYANDLQLIGRKLNEFLRTDPLLKSTASSSMTLQQEKEILCGIAAIDPSRATYAYYDLNPFRELADECSLMCDSIFQTLRLNALIAQHG